MTDQILNQTHIRMFSEYLRQEEKSAATQEKYLRDVRALYVFLSGRPVTKELVLAYKKNCIEQGYAVRSVNSMLASINSLLVFLGWTECKVKSIRLQKQTYCAEEKELTKAEYLRLLEASKKNEQLNLVLKTICSTGIRVSELKFFTLERVQKGTIVVSCKNKTRTILIPGKLKKLLLEYAKRKTSPTGPFLWGATASRWTEAASGGK